MKFFKKSDIWVILFLIVIAGTAFFLWRSTMEGLPARAEIYLGSDLQESIDLTSPIPLQFSLDQRPGVTFEIFEDGSIAFAGSDCPDKICVHSGRLGIPGQSAACIPNLLFIRIVSAAEDESGGYPDIISG